MAEFTRREALVFKVKVIAFYASLTAKELRIIFREAKGHLPPQVIREVRRDVRAYRRDKEALIAAMAKKIP